MTTTTSVKRKTGTSRLLTLSGLFTAVIFVTTAYIHIPTGMGYTHAGDGFIFLAAAMLPKKYAVPAAAAGAALADLASGMSIWIPATVIIKALTVLPFTSKHGKTLVPRNYAALIPALILCAGGYSIYEALIMTDGSASAAFAAAFGQVPFYAVQIGIGAAVFTALGRAADASHLFASARKQ